MFLRYFLNCKLYVSDDDDDDLCLGEAECEGEAETFTDGQVASQPELALERRQLIVAERRPSSTSSRPAAAARVVVAADAAVDARVGGDGAVVVTASTGVGVTTKTTH